jgi:hypothetical protein
VWGRWWSGKEIRHVERLDGHILTSVQRSLTGSPGVQQDSLGNRRRQRLTIVALSAESVVTEKERNVLLIEERQPFDQSGAADSRDVALVAAFAGPLIRRVEIEKVAVHRGKTQR